MKKTLFMAAVLAFATTTTAWAQQPLQQTTANDLDAQYATELLKEGTPAPDFSLSTPGGKTLKLSDYKGHYVVVDFWASWCPDCRRDLPNILRMYRTYSERGVRFVGVSFDDKKANLEKAIADFKLPYPQVSEYKKWKQTAISTAYRINWIPTTYLIDPQGKVLVATVMSEKIEAALARLFPACCEDNAPTATVR